MSFEYHAWIVLATSQINWSDEDFETGYEQVIKAIESLPLIDGHEPILPQSEVLPRILYLKGIHVKSLEPVFQTLRTVAAVFSRAYGEIVIFEENDSCSYPVFSSAKRYYLAGETLSSASH
jgi:hypothetical protein